MINHQFAENICINQVLNNQLIITLSNITNRKLFMIMILLTISVSYINRNL